MGERKKVAFAREAAVLGDPLFNFGYGGEGGSCGIAYSGATLFRKHRNQKIDGFPYAKTP